MVDFNSDVKTLNAENTKEGREIQNFDFTERNLKWEESAS